MKLEQILEWARAEAVGSQSQYRSSEAAAAILELLAEAAPCGWPEPEVRRGIVGIPNEWAYDFVTPNEARAFGRMCFSGADEAESPTAQEPPT